MRQEANRALNIVKRYGKDNKTDAICSVYSLKFCRILHSINSPEKKQKLLSNAKNLAL